MAPLIPNQFGQGVVLGQLDLRFNPNTVSCEVDATQVGSLTAGQAVKLVDSVNGIPKIVGVTADTDDVFGFINFDGKLPSYSAQDKCEVSTNNDNCMYLQATAAIGRGARVSIVSATVGGVAAAVTGGKVVGWAFDKATAAGQLLRVMLRLPSNTHTLAP